MKKKILALLISIIICSCSIPIVLNAATFATGTCGDNLTWTLDDQGKLTISGTGNMEDYQSSQDTRWDDYSHLINSVVITDGVTSIGNFAFYDCGSLKTIQIPASVTSIGDASFYQCDELTSISLPSSLMSIGVCAFSSCFKLNSIQIPQSVKSIGIGAFSCCFLLNSIKIPYGITEIPEQCFEACVALTTVILPETVTGIAASAFLSDDAITDVFFQGADKSSININESGNEPLINARWYCDIDNTLGYAKSASIVTADQNMNVIHSVNPSYTVIIPAETIIGSSATVSASDIKIEQGKNLTVKISATSGENNAYTLTSAEGAVITYSVKKGGNNVVVGTPFLSVSANDSSGSATLDFALVSEEKYAGNYTGTVTFTVSVVNNGGMYNKDFPGL